MKIESEARKRDVKPVTTSVLWGVCAGRCELCNRPLYQNHAFGMEGNYAQMAHIHAVSENGPRSVKEMTNEELNNTENLMLLCYDDHKMIDSNPSYFTGPTLIEQKKAHERRIRDVTEINPQQTCQILTYFCGVTENVDLFHFNLMRYALLLSHKIPLQEGPLFLAKHSDIRYEPTKDGFEKKANELEQNYRYWNENSGLKQEALAVFSLAPMALLIKLGVLLGDRKNVTVYQCHRQGHKWAWPDETSHVIKYITSRTTTINQGPVALVLDLSARVDDMRIINALGQNATIYHVTIDKPNRDFVTSEKIQTAFIKHFRNVMEEIKSQHPALTELHVFPVMPNSLAIRAGMDYMPKTDPSMIVYEQANQQEGFFEALQIGGTQ